MRELLAWSSDNVHSRRAAGGCGKLHDHEQRSLEVDGSSGEEDGDKPPGGVATATAPSHVLPPPHRAIAPVKEIGGALVATPDESPCWVRAAVEALVRPFNTEQRRTDQ
jgi:hypothetical protein